jgi:hypothetical protein
LPVYPHVMHNVAPSAITAEAFREAVRSCWKDRRVDVFFI